MAKRRTRDEVKADKIIKDALLKMGEEVLNIAVPNSRRDTGRLQDEMNFEVKPDTTLTMYQMYYGEYNYPAGKNSGEKNALRIAINEMIPETTEVIIKNITDWITKDYK